MRKLYAVLLAVSTAVSVLGMGAIPAVAQPTVQLLFQEGQCFLSQQDSDPATGIAYFILEDAGTDTCELAFFPGSYEDRQRLDVTVIHTVAVIYPLGRRGFPFTLRDATTGDEVSCVNCIGLSDTGARAFPPIPATAPVVNGCAHALVHRTVAGHLADYDTGWNVVSQVNAPLDQICASQVITSTSSAVTSFKNTCTLVPSTCGFFPDEIVCPLLAYPAMAAPRSFRTECGAYQVAFPRQFGITLEKSVETLSGGHISEAVPGQTVVYKYKVTNTGDTPWTVTINDNRPGLRNLRCPQPVLPAGESMVCTAEYTVTEADLRAGKVTDTATATGTDSDTGDSVTSNESSAIFPVSAIPAPAPAPAPAPHHRPRVPVTG